MSKAMTITRRYEFQSAHMLPHVPKGHKCGRLHGHSYKLDITVWGEVDPARGWFMDFAELDAIVDPVVAMLDHRYLNEIEGLDNPTTENVCLWIREALGKDVHPGCLTITIRENERSAVTL